MTLLPASAYSALAAAIGLPGAGGHWRALVVTISFAFIARLLRGVTYSGAIAGGVVCYLLYLGAGPGGIATLLAVFVVTWLGTRFRRGRKQALGTAEKYEGRNAAQVLANLAVAACCAALFALVGVPALLIAASAALSEAAADTVSSEVGQVGAATARLITTFEPVPAGTDGGVTFLGSIAGLLAAAIVSLVASVSGVLPSRMFLVSVGAAMAGMFADSLLGAVMERRKLLNNEAVNLLGTMVAGLLGSILAR